MLDVLHCQQCTAALTQLREMLGTTVVFNKLLQLCAPNTCCLTFPLNAWSAGRAYMAKYTADFVEFS